MGAEPMKSIGNRHVREAGMKKLWIAIFLMGASAQLAVSQIQTARVTGGEVQGVVTGGISTFKGIPFAAPPAGDLRWKAPAPVKAWTGVKNAISIYILDGRTKAGRLARETKGIHGGSGSKQGWQRLDGKNQPSPGQRTGPVPASSVFRARRRNIPRTTGHNFTDQISANRPNTYHPIGIIEPLPTLHRAAPLVRMDPMFCSGRFGDGAGCGRQRGDL